jgi:hypothetical protein
MLRCLLLTQLTHVAYEVEVRLLYLVDVHCVVLELLGPEQHQPHLMSLVVEYLILEHQLQAIN